MIPEVRELSQNLDDLGYIVEEELATVLLLSLKLGKPLLLEGPPGVGKTQAANIIASYLETNLIRLQCYEGLDASAAIYEWNYQKQLLSIKANESSSINANQLEDQIFGEQYLLKRPLLQAISATDKAPVLLIDEIDRADEEFEAFLLELLSDFQITIPEMGSIRAAHKPIVILTSNRTRELSDALKRRCLYHWINYPHFSKEIEIIKKRHPQVNEQLAVSLVKFVNHLREMNLQKLPGVAESLDWAGALLSLQIKSIRDASVEHTLGCILKSDSDIQQVKELGISNVLNEIMSK